MSAPTQPEADTVLEGILERVVFSNDEDAWSVLKLAVRGRRELATVVGNVLGVQVGEQLRLAGRWVVDRKWGEQFQATSYSTVHPATVEGIERYLGSGLIHGIGKGFARRLVERFGLATLEILEQHPERFKQVPGIGEKRLAKILESWNEQRAVQRVMVFLQSHGVSTAFAIRIFKTYGPDAVDVVTENPYRLANEVHGIGFKSADRIAADLGVPKDSPRRVEAGCTYLLAQAASSGHLFLPRERLVDEASEILGVREGLVFRALKELVRAGDVVVETAAGEAGAGGEIVYPAPLHAAETGLAASLKALLAAPGTLPALDVPRALEWLERRFSLELASQQRQAIAEALGRKVLVITGGPGTGKTTLLKGIVEILDRKGARILLAAPTGRAARRLAEATGMEAKTLHRLLEFDPQGGAFLRGPGRPLDADLVIVDEASMLDVPLAGHTAAAMPQGGHLVLVGDVDQLPSVGPGRVLADLITSGAVPVVRLTEIFRQAAASRIVVGSHAINEGKLPPLDGRLQEDPACDFFFIERERPEEVLETLLYLTTERIPKSFGLDPVAQIQILTPMNKGPLGVHNLNAVLQERLNPASRRLEAGGEGPASLARGGRTFRVGDKVMQVRNNYELDVFNGDVGRVVAVDAEEAELGVAFDGRELCYAQADLDELVLAYACTIHKSQGSEYPCAVVPVHTQHYRMLQRNLFYTALTRAKKLAVLVGQKKALALAVRNQDTRERFTRLAYRLR